MSRCYVCGRAPAPNAEPRNPLCERCAPARDHVVSMSSGATHRIATCACGWDYREPIGGARNIDDVVIEHWKSIVAEAVRIVSAKDAGSVTEQGR